MAYAKRYHSCGSADRSEQNREQGNPQLMSQPRSRAEPAEFGMNIFAHSVTPTEIIGQTRVQLNCSPRARSASGRIVRLREVR